MIFPFEKVWIVPSSLQRKDLQWVTHMHRTSYKKALKEISVSEISQGVEKVRLQHLYPSVYRCFPFAPTEFPDGKQRKASDSTAHIAGFALHLESCSPPNHPKGFFDSLNPRPERGFSGYNKKGGRTWRPPCFSAIRTAAYGSSRWTAPRR